jgi:hypothetical protein
MEMVMSAWIEKWIGKMFAPTFEMLHQAPPSAMMRLILPF